MAVGLQGDIHVRVTARRHLSETGKLPSLLHCSPVRPYAHSAVGRHRHHRHSARAGTPPVRNGRETLVPAVDTGTNAWKHTSSRWQTKGFAPSPTPTPDRGAPIAFRLS